MRLDKWLYYSRFCKTRTGSNSVCNNGDVLVNKFKKFNSSYNLLINDIITLITDEEVKVIKVLSLPKNRISPKEANKIYEILN
tara:strand:- start:112 stop:360 length:249 start_codon:yes stop_codon:yes gene_type:complete